MMKNPSTWFGHTGPPQVYLIIPFLNVLRGYLVYPSTWFGHSDSPTSAHECFDSETDVLTDRVRLRKKLWSELPGGERVRVTECRNAACEVAALAQKMKSRREVRIGHASTPRTLSSLQDRECALVSYTGTVRFGLRRAARGVRWLCL